MPSSLPHVLFVADKLGYPGGVAFGGTTYFLNVLPALVEAGLSLTTCFLREPHPLARELRERGLDPIFLSAVPADPTVALKLAAVARRHRSGILHSAGIKGTLMARMAARSTHANVIVHVHDQKDPGAVIRGLNRVVAQPTDLGICVSRAVQGTAIHGYHLSPERLRVIPNGLDLEKFRRVPEGTRERVRAALGVADGTHVLGLFGRFYPVKGHKLMLQMLPRIVAVRPDVLLLLAGEGPERAECESLTDRLGLREHVRFLGQRDDIPQLLTACDVFLMPSQTEGLPLAAIEALALGRPVVGFEVGGVPEVVDDGRTGYLVPHGDQDGFVAAVLRLVGDADKLADFAARSWRAAERFSVAAHVQGLLSCYRELAANPGAIDGKGPGSRT
jgi:glycosyltransferase involved in cell wall biosynthesis